jgi:hypothetical protein
VTFRCVCHLVDDEVASVVGFDASPGNDACVPVLVHVTALAEGLKVIGALVAEPLIGEVVDFYGWLRAAGA